jgi:peroxiredoxin family protein
MLDGDWSSDVRSSDLKMEKANIPALSDLQEMAQAEGVKFVACRMTVDMMELSEKDFIDGVTIQTAEEFLKFAQDCKILLYT